MLLIDTASTSGERMDMEIAAEVTTPVTESSTDESKRWIEEVKGKCESAFKGLLWQSPKIRESTFSEQLSRPRVVTIGPIFHRDKSADITDEEKYLIVYLMNHLYDLDLESCLMMMKNQVADARKCYSDSGIIYPKALALQKTTDLRSFGSTNDNRFAEMLLLDSYFILFMLTFTVEIHSEVTCDEGVNLYLYRHYSSKCLKIMPGKLFRADPSKKRKIMLALHVVPRFADILHNKDLIMVDLLILRNQIPFFVIEELFKELQLENPLHKYALEFFETIHPRSTRGCNSQNSPPEFSHLLHLFHWSRVPENKCNVLIRSWRPQLDDFYWGRYTPTAMKLRTSAAGFKKKTSGSSLDITFRSDRLIPVVRVLDIPCLHIDEYSSWIFHNLIAFEMQLPRISDRRTVAFTAIMENLLQSEEDVKLLRRCGILVSSSMTDYKIISFFKSLSQMAENVDIPIDVYVFCRQVLSYHIHRMSRFYANAILKYFPNW